jgi:serine/threonine-protein kinase/endoribonuclease IRE1
MLRQMSEAVAFLHSLGLIHRNLKPNNFMIAEVATQPQAKYTIKLTDMCKSKNINLDPENSGTLATDCWIAPEMLNKGPKLDQKMDTFILGCVFYYVSSNGRHPFGEGHRREGNICDASHPVYKEDWVPDSDPKLASLIKRMIKFQQKDRPTMQKVLEDVYFKPSDEEIYDLYAGTKKAGLCVIINQEKFQKKVINLREEGGVNLMEEWG